jgi:formylglycine-generating enzyme required for sulfatase activity
MARIEKTVFISYRRADVYTALAVYENLKNQGYDVFFDYRSISSGDFEQIITSNIRARAHFLLILTPTALDRCNEPGDWLRREIELAIDEKRNIIPLFFKGFRFGTPSVSEKLTGKMQFLNRYNGLNVHEDYFEEAMHRLSIQYLNLPLDTILHPVSTEVQKVVREEQVAADKALEQIEDVKELVKQVEEKPDQTKVEPIPERKVSLPAVSAPLEVAESPIPSSSFNSRLVGGIAVGVLLIALLVWGGISIFQNQSTATPTPQYSIGSTMTGKDGMTLLYVPAGEFTMGSDNGELDEKPVHNVYLDAFWIDKTEVTNAMFAKCVQDGACNQPSSRVYTLDDDFGNSEFDNYPVINVSWNDAKAYCEWADRRLPTEAEWEKAARGENALVYPWGNNFEGTLVNFCDKNCPLDWADRSSDDGYRDTAPVGSYPAGKSIYGALDMSGNVREWVSSLYQAYPYSATDGREDLIASGSRVLRGGSWYYDDSDVRSASRIRSDPANTNGNIGFRCSRSP